MCGISGFLGPNNLSPKRDTILKTLELMKNRGKDDSGTFEYNINDKFKINLNHTRLSIIDPRPNSSQPFNDEESSIVFNGMIYNYIEIRKKLLKKKIKFYTNSDTEVLLKFLNYYGPEKLYELDGMWSFAYLNFKKKKIILSRDRFGEKPLYYNIDKNSLVFGSCLNYIQSLRQKKFQLNYNKFENYLKFGFRTLNNENESFFKNIYSLDPGKYISIDKNFKIKEHKFWSPESVFVNKKLNFNNEIKKLNNLYKNIIKMRLRSDFPLSCLLSGGIDSSSMISSANKITTRKIKCFSIKAKDLNYDEEKYIKKTINKNKINHEFVNVKKNTFKNLRHLKNIISQTSSLVPTSTWFIFSILCKEIKNQNFKVVLSGTGGDEIFAGYYIHHLHFLYSIRKTKLFKEKFDEWEKYIKPRLRNKFLKDYNFYEEEVERNKDVMFHDFMTMKKYFKTFKINKSKKIKQYFNDFFKNNLFKDLIYYSLPPQITAIDNISLYHGLESRAPFLSKHLFEKSFSYPSNFLIHSGYGKYIFRKSSKNVVDKEVLNNRDKIGFFMNINNIFDLNNKKFQKLLFSNNFINSLINKKKLKNLLKKKNISTQECHFIFAILNIIFFIKKYG